MKPINIIILISVIVLVSIIIGIYIYKKLTHKPTGECACCAKKSNIVKQYHKKYHR